MPSVNDAADLPSSCRPLPALPSRRSTPQQLSVRTSMGLLSRNPQYHAGMVAMPPVAGAQLVEIFRLTRLVGSRSWWSRPYVSHGQFHHPVLSSTTAPTVTGTPLCGHPR